MLASRNITTMSGKSKETIHMTKWKTLDILCVGYKLYQDRHDEMRNGVGVTVNRDYAKDAIEMKWISVKVMSRKL